LSGWTVAYLRVTLALAVAVTIRSAIVTELVDLILKNYEHQSEKYRRMIPLKMVYIPVTTIIDASFISLPFLLLFSQAPAKLKILIFYTVRT